jgi:hypothetical protein
MEQAAAHGQRMRRGLALKPKTLPAAATPFLTHRCEDVDSPGCSRGDDAFGMAASSNPCVPQQK